MDWEQIKGLKDKPRFVYEGKGTIPSKNDGGSLLIPIDITSDAHFYSELITITYQTLSDAGDPKDDGVNHLSLKITDGSTRRELNTDFIDRAPFSSPGRQRTQGIAGDPSQELHVSGFPWPYLWESNGAIQLDVRNDSDVPLKVTFQFHGFKYPVSIWGAVDE